MNAFDPSLVPVKSSARRKPILIALAVIVCLGLVAGAVLLLTKSSNSQAKLVQVRPALTVTIARPSQVNWAETLNASGAIAPWQEAIIGSQIGGYQLDQLHVNVGDHVKKGQILARLNPDLLHAEEAQLIAAYEQAQANAKRAVSLQGSGGISDQDVLQATTLAKTAQAQLAFKQLQLRYTDVIAPDDGVISARSATIGAVVSSGQELFRMIIKGRLEWRGELTAEQLSRIAPQQRVTLALPGAATAVAVVRQIAPSLDNGSRLGLVYADIAEANTSSASTIASTMQQMSISFGVACASLATAFFIPDRFHSSAPQMIHGIHQAFLCLGALTVLSTLVFTELKSGDGDSVSLHKELAQGE